jgi:hypothetical protein
LSVCSANIRNKKLPAAGFDAKLLGLVYPIPSISRIWALYFARIRALSIQL